MLLEPPLPFWAFEFVPLFEGAGVSGGGGGGGGGAAPDPLNKPLGRGGGGGGGVGWCYIFY